MHDDKHPLAGKTVKVMTTRHVQIGDGPHEYRLEDWWDHLTGSSWMDTEGNPACLVYAMRAAFAELPVDDEVVYGKVGSFGHLVHVSEIMDGESA
jgi:hypothetical protein